MTFASHTIPYHTIPGLQQDSHVVVYVGKLWVCSQCIFIMGPGSVVVAKMLIQYVG